MAEVIRDAKYFAELRKAVGGTSPTALLGTSALTMHLKLELAQTQELRGQLAPHVYTRYSWQMWLLRTLVRTVPWISCFLILSSILNAISHYFTSLDQLYTWGGWLFVRAVAIFFSAKFIQITLLRSGSELIRLFNGVKYLENKSDSLESDSLE